MITHTFVSYCSQASLPFPRWLDDLLLVLLSNRNALREDSYKYEKGKMPRQACTVFLRPFFSFLFVAATRICGILLRHRIPTSQASRDRPSINCPGIQQHCCPFRPPLDSICEDITPFFPRLFKRRIPGLFFANLQTYKFITPHT